MKGKRKTALFLTLLALFLCFLSFNGWSEDLAGLEKTWEEFQASLPAAIPKIKLAVAVDTTGLLNKQKDDLARLTQAPFLRVVDFDYAAGIEQRINQARANKQELEADITSLKAAAVKYQEAAFSEKLSALANLDSQQQENITQNLRFYPEIFKIYEALAQEDGSLAEMSAEIEVLQKKQQTQIAARQQVQKEYQELLAPLLAALKDNSLAPAGAKLEKITETPEIAEFFQVIRAWFNNPQQPLPESRLTYLINFLYTALEEEGGQSAVLLTEKIYKTENMLASNLQERLEEAIKSRDAILTAYQNYREFLLSEHVSWLLDESVAAEDLISAYMIEGRQVAKGWQPEGTWNYPLTYQFKGVRGKLFTVDVGAEPLTEVVTVDDAVIKRLPQIKFLRDEENNALVTALKNLHNLIATVQKTGTEAGNLITLLKENDNKEKALLTEKSAAIDKLLAAAAERFGQIREDIKADKYLKTSSEDFRQFLEQEKTQLANFQNVVFLIYKQGLDGKIKEAQEKLDQQIWELIKEYKIRCACQYEDEYNQELGGKLAVLQQNITSFLEAKDDQEIAKNYQKLQIELRNIKRGNVKVTETGETLTLRRSPENDALLNNLEAQWEKAQLLYYKATTVPTLKIQKVGDQDAGAAEVTLAAAATTVEVKGQANVVYAAAQNGFTVSKVEYSVDGGQSYMAATGTEEWSFSLPLKSGQKVELLIRAQDSVETYSIPVKINISVPAPPAPAPTEEKGTGKDGQ